ncbi:hypothetical protein MRB53_035596 [Persea americana]|uniref:Uncharacterized protein n=1 Tax=Persea americana TaxID=3435 RepID=A0ACC2K530_PERAE|nr:hypothetical protein MRB53_035596 [Persea americana]
MAESNSQGQKQGQGRHEAMETVAPQAPVTLERKVLEDLDEKLPKPYLPRALVAADTEHPSGTWGHQHFTTLVFSNSMLPSLTWTMMALFPAYRLQFHIFFHLDRSDQRIHKGGSLLHFFQYMYTTYINLSTEVTPELTTLREVNFISNCS